MEVSGKKLEQIVFTVKQMLKKLNFLKNNPPRNIEFIEVLTHIFGKFI